MKRFVLTAIHNWLAPMWWGMCGREKLPHVQEAQERRRPGFQEFTESLLVHMSPVAQWLSFTNWKQLSLASTSTTTPLSWSHSDNICEIALWLSFTHVTDGLQQSPRPRSFPSASTPIGRYYLTFLNLSPVYCPEDFSLSPSFALTKVVLVSCGYYNKLLTSLVVWAAFLPPSR
jgi:hypothetical protein